MEWSTACTDWEKRIVQRESLIACPPLFPQMAEDAWSMCSEFILMDVGCQRLGDLSLPWLRDFVMAVFGAEDPETGRRHINEFFLMVSKKNAKSTIAAGIMLCALLMNWRQFISSAHNMMPAAMVDLAFFFDTMRKNSLMCLRPVSGSSAPNTAITKSRSQGSDKSPRR